MKTIPTDEPPDLSLVLGGPLFQLYRRMRLTGNGMELLRRRVLVITLFAWLPLLVLSVLGGHALGGGIRIPFLHDIEAHVRFLVALPMLILAEVTVHQRLGPAIRRFVERGIVVTEDLPRFSAAINSALRVRNSVVVELALVVVVYTLGHWIWWSRLSLETATWYAMPQGGHIHLTWAGYWYAWLSIPIFQFLLLRWYMRLVLWFWLLWQVSRLNLHLTAAHPDRAAGISFVGRTSYAFAPILSAQGALLSALIARQVLFEGKSLLSFQLEAAGYLVFFILFILAPLTVFTPHLLSAKRKGRAEYGLLASRYVFGFEEKWIQRAVPAADDLLGTGDIQSLADLANSYALVREMRLVPFGLQDVGQLAIATAVPLLPLMLTVFSPEQLLAHLLKILFQ